VLKGKLSHTYIQCMDSFDPEAYRLMVRSGEQQPVPATSTSTCPRDKWEPQIDEDWFFTPDCLLSPSRGRLSRSTEQEERNCFSTTIACLYLGAGQYTGPVGEYLGNARVHFALGLEPVENQEGTFRRMGLIRSVSLLETENLRHFEEAVEQEVRLL
jgi:hypothetical protein